MRTSVPDRLQVSMPVIKIAYFLNYAEAITDTIMVSEKTQDRSGSFLFIFRTGHGLNNQTGNNEEKTNNR